MVDSTSLNEQSLGEFFRDRVHGSLRHLHLNLSQDVEFYLVNLLIHFSTTDKLYDRSENGEVKDIALVEMLLNAHILPSQQVPILKKMGDVSLYISGFFSDSLFKKMINLDYYIKMGNYAYASLSHLMTTPFSKGIKPLFHELAEKFIPLVEVISGIADETHLKADQNLLKVYERWLTLGTDKDNKRLMSQGLIPNELLKGLLEQ